MTDEESCSGSHVDSDRPRASSQPRLTVPPPLAVADAIHAENAALRRQAELERAVFERIVQLEAANREFDALSYSVSRDLLEPLCRIDRMGRGMLLDHAESLDLEERACLRRVCGAAQRSLRSIEGLLGIAHFGRRQLRRQRVDLSAMAHAVLADLRDGEPSRAIEVGIDDGLHAECDPGLARIVLENLLHNAWKFSANQALARIELRWSGVRAAFCVCDNGVGFDMRDAGRLFVPHGCLHQAHEFDGLGMGLAIVKRIFLRHGGRVWAQSAPSQGARFWFAWS